MAIMDPISDMFTRVRNALRVGHEQVVIPHSKIKEAIAKVLVAEGFIEGVDVEDLQNNKRQISIRLKYVRANRPAITSLRVISRPSNRVYVKKSAISKPLNGFGISIISTNKGILTGKQARLNSVGGELIGEIY